MSKLMILFSLLISAQISLASEIRCHSLEPNFEEDNVTLNINTMQSMYWDNDTESYSNCSFGSGEGEPWVTCVNSNTSEYTTYYLTEQGVFATLEFYYGENEIGFYKFQCE